MSYETNTDIVRSECLNDFGFFTRYFFKELHGKKFVLNHHHQTIFEACTRVINGDCKRLIINIAPRYSKTEIVVKNLIAYSLALNPESRFIHLSYSDSLALDNSEEIKDMVTSAEYQALFPYVQIKADSRAKNKWYTTEGGGVLARSSSGQVTGFGAGIVDEADKEATEFGGAIIIDDPIKPEEADSDVQREKVNNRFNSTIRNRVNSRNTPIIIVMQRLHENDLCGYLLDQEPGEWEVISLPVINEENEALWPFKHTIEELRQMQKDFPSVFATQYMQDPTPKEGLMLPKSELNHTTNLEHEQEAKIAYIDTADTGKDYHCAVIGELVSDKIFVTDVVYTTEQVSVNLPMSANLLNKHQPEYVRVEVNMGGTMYPSMLRPLVGESTNILNVRSKTNKHTRIITMEGFIKNHVVFLDPSLQSEEYKLFYKNVTTYRKAQQSSPQDDGIDALVGLCRMARDFYPHLWTISQI